MNIQWLHVDELEANDWNPNVVHNDELKLLETSILKIGWVQAIQINTNRKIIDGFHRTELSRHSKAIRQKYNGMVPCVLFDVPDDKAMIMTIRINRAKGTHVAQRMSDIIKQLVNDYAYTVNEICLEIGATEKEVQLLLSDSIYKHRNLKQHKYSTAWIPTVK